MLSGIGPREHLEEVGIPLVMDAPAVGEGLQDHAAVLVSHACTKRVSLTDKIRNTLFFSLSLNVAPPLLPYVQNVIQKNKKTPSLALSH